MIGLQVDIDHLPILVDSPPQVVLLTVDLNEYLINVERIAIAPMFSLQPLGELRSELDTPQPDRFVADSNTSLGQQIFDISVAQVEAVVEPHRVTDNLRWESVSLVCIHPLIISQGDLT